MRKCLKPILILALISILLAPLVGCAGGKEADETPPVVSGVSASSITETGAVITWTTDEPATSQVEYGLTTGYGSTTTLDDDLVTSHSVNLSGLTADTTYHYRVKSKDASENEAVSGNYTFATAIFFPDENLETAIREAIGKPEGDMQQVDLEGLTELDADERGITDLTGLEHCINLTRLNLWANQVGEISALENLTSLTELELSGNQMSDITPLQNLTSLTALYLEDNQINDIAPLSNLTTLKYLNLRDNRINDISPLADNEGLSEGDKIGLEGNPLNADSINVYIPQLEARGVTMLYDAP